MDEPIIRVVNWDSFQHYKKKRPPWIKLYRDLLTNYEVTCLEPWERWCLVGIYLLAAETENRIPADPQWLRARLVVPETPPLKKLERLGFIEVGEVSREALESDYSESRETLEKVYAKTETETETEAETEKTPGGGRRRSSLPETAHARDSAPPPPNGDHLASLKSYLDGHPGIDEVAAMVEDAGRWAMGLLGLYGPSGTEERLMSGVPDDERPEVLATALIRYATDADEWDSRYFRGFVRKAIAERKRDREPPSRDWGDETERDRARMEAYHQREVKRGEEKRDEKAEAKSQEIDELLEWFDDQPEDVQDEIEADAESRVKVMAVGLGPGKKPPDIMIRSAQLEAIREAKRERDE